MPAAITRYSGDVLQQAKRWVDLDSSERRRRAVEASRDRDESVLWDLTLSYLTLHGKAGSRLSRNTASAYRTSIRQFLEANQDTSLIHLSRDDAAVWIRSLEAAGKSPSTITVRLAGVRRLYAALRWARALDHDPLADVRPAKDPTPASEKRHPYPDDAVSALLAIAQGEDRLLVLLGAHTGLRVSEILALEWSDVDMSQRRITVRCGKGGKMRSVVASQTLMSELLAAPRYSRNVISGYRTPQSARNHLRRLCQQAGTRYQTVHALRHSSGTRLYRQTGRLEDAQHHLGHSDISTTQVYASYADEALTNSVGSW